jgi:hypothetical protein
MNQAHFKMLTDIIRSEADDEPRAERLDIVPDPDTIDKIAALLRKGVTRGIYPQWTFRKEIDARPTEENFAAIANCVENGFTSGNSSTCGDVPFGWRIDVYAVPSSNADDAAE